MVNHILEWVALDGHLFILGFWGKKSDKKQNCLRQSSQTFKYSVYKTLLNTQQIRGLMT